MLNKIKNRNIRSYVFVIIFGIFAYPAIAVDDEYTEDMSANSILEYNVDGSVFQKITDMEQEKILMQLEKERAQLDLELDRLAAEKIKLHMEIDTLSGRAEEQQALLESERAKLESMAANIERERRPVGEEDISTESVLKQASVAKKIDTSEDVVAQSVSVAYRLVDIIGAGNQLQATIEDIKKGQRKKISVGKRIDGYIIKSISLDEGVVFEKDGVIETLNIGRSN